MSKALIEILGDAMSYLRSLRKSSEATSGFEVDLKKLAVTAQTTAQAQVRASVTKDARMRAEIRTYREIAAAATRGSREQIAASNLATQAEGRLSRSLAVTSHEARKLSGGLRTAERDASAAGRGALFGSGAFHGLGRSLFYASSYILGGYGIVAGLKSAISASIEEKQQVGQLSTAVKDAGLSYKLHRGEIDKTLASQRALGFAQDDSIANLAAEVRATRSITGARQALSLADNIARGKHIALSVAANAVARAYGGQTGALRRLVPFISKSATATEALKQAQTAYAGAANKYALSEAGTQARLGVALHHTAVIIGDEMTPEVTKLSSKLATWLSSSKNQARVQRDVKEAVHDVAAVAKVLFGILKTGIGIVRSVTGALGGAKTTIELLGTAILAMKFAKATSGLAGIAAKAGLGTSKVAALRSGLNSLNGLAVVATVEIIVLESIKSKITKYADMINNAKTHFLQLDLQGVKDAAAYWQKLRSHLSPQEAQIDFYAKYGGQGPTQENLLAQAIQYSDGGANRALLLKKLAKGKQTGRTTPAPRDRTSDSKAAQALQQNQLALAAAKTDSQKLTALVDERQLLATRMGEIRKQLKHASGTERDLLIGELTTLTKQDTAAYKQIASIQKSEHAKAAAAARKAAHEYLQGITTTATNLLAEADSAKTVTAVRKTYAKLIAYYKTEAADTHLTALQRARYAKLAIDEQKKMAKQIAADEKAQKKAIETKQLASLGVGAGQSISELLQRVKDAATAKEEGIPSVGTGPPSVRALKTEADQVAKALKGTYLDTNVSRSVISKIKTLLSGQLGSLNSEMRNKIQQLLQGLRNDMKSFDGFNLSAADKRRRFLDKRFADRYGTNVAGGSGLPRVRSGGLGRMAASKVSPQVIHYHFEPHMQVIANEPIGHALDRSFFRQRVAMGR